MFPNTMSMLSPCAVPVFNNSGAPQTAPLTLEDPLFPSRNSAAACFAFPNIAAEFEAAVLVLASYRPSVLRPTPLSAIIPRHGYAL